MAGEREDSLRANGFTHVSVHAYNLDESVRFYTELFEMKEIPAPDFPSPVRWLRVGDLQLHLFKSARRREVLRLSVPRGGRATPFLVPSAGKEA